MHRCNYIQRKDSKNTCQYETAYQQQMREHKINSHQFIACGFADCGQILRNRNSLNSHSETHTHDQHCSGCQKIFKDSGTAYKHLTKCRDNNPSAKINKIQKNATGSSIEIAEANDNSGANANVFDQLKELRDANDYSFTGITHRYTKINFSHDKK